MQIAEIKKRAKDLSVRFDAKTKKLELVRAIQTKEGNFPCFGTAEVYCDQLNCSFRDDCLSRNVN
ncbi:MAG: SAP domain-containing protein [Deltaproteobacteria bacterium]|nr:SAP domain-containing protein [Deltaproteobacteria bacterium]